MIDETLRMYAVVRRDLAMPPGKLASQAGHAFLDTYQKCLEEYPDRAELYRSDGPGTKVVLEADCEADLICTQQLAEAYGIPCALIIDSGHIMPPHFDGNPIVTALGLGPVRRDDRGAFITNRFQLAK